MKRLIILFFILQIIACKNSFENTEAYIDDTIDYCADTSYLAKVSDYDSIYQFHGRGGWGEFDFLCSIYRQNVPPQYKAQLYYRSQGFKEREVSAYDWQYLTAQIEKIHFFKDTFRPTNMCDDCPTYYLLAKNGEQLRKVDISDFKMQEWLFLSKKEFKINFIDLDLTQYKIFSTDMMTLCRYPNPEMRIDIRFISDSIKLKMFSTGFHGLVKKSIYNHPFKNGYEDGYGRYFITLHRNEYRFLDDIELVSELINGKILRTKKKTIRDISAFSPSYFD